MNTKIYAINSQTIECCKTRESAYLFLLLLHRNAKNSLINIYVRQPNEMTILTIIKINFQAVITYNSLEICMQYYSIY